MDHSLSGLLCQENRAEAVVVDEDLYVQFEDSNASEDEYVDVLTEKEIGLGFGRDESSVLSDWIKTARLYAINWILKTRATFGFRFQTAYLSVTYFDRFLSRRFIDSERCWAFRLLSVACLSLAAKMEECDVPALSEFPSQDYNFESKVIQRMELLVLCTLDWNMNFTTPFAFLPYFIPKFSNQSPPAHIWSNIMQLIFTLMTEVNLMDHRPSVIAAAATLVAIDPHLTRKAVELKMSSVSQYWIHEIENIYASYDLIQRLHMEKTERDKMMQSSSPPSPVGSMAINKLEASVVSSAVTSKRRRLTFTDHEESRGTHDGS
ncbi:cyclin-D5-1-like [Prosopis cineraria]|uniref:cyclin-D5-1-like n=1 Tax=Prosopis cineraria TaxID=364024 RepID=UPI00240FAC20|nr:cyclin-D5-1-like [Prosopis cineraria]